MTIHLVGVDTRERLIAGAIELVTAGDEDALTLRALGEHCGLSRGAPYRHFEDKDALIRAIAAAGFTELTKKMKRAGDLRGAMRAYVAWGLKNPAWYGLTFRSDAAGPKKAEDAELKSAAMTLLSLVTELIVSAQRDDELSKQLRPDEYVGLLWSVLHGTVDLAVTGHAKAELATDDARKTVDRLMDLLQP